MTAYPRSVLIPPPDRPLADGFRPDCMTSDELKLWLEAALVAWRHARPASSPCVDCPLVWAEAMRDQGLCNGTPGDNMTGRPRSRKTHQSAYRARNIERIRERDRLRKRRAYRGKGNSPAERVE